MFLAVRDISLSLKPVQYTMTSASMVVPSSKARPLSVKLAMGESLLTLKSPLISIAVAPVSMLCDFLRLGCKPARGEEALVSTGVNIERLADVAAGVAEDVAEASLVQAIITMPVQRERPTEERRERMHGSALARAA